MRTLLALAIGLWCADATGNPSQLAGAAHVTCDGASHVVVVTGTYYWGIEGEYTSIVLERSPVGVCQPAELLMDYAQPFEPEPSETYNADYICKFVIPSPPLSIVYKYVPYGVKSDGGLQMIYYNCTSDLNSSALVDCVDAPFERGTVILGSGGGLSQSFRIIGCDEHCWTAELDFDISQEDLEQHAGEPAWELFGQVVDVFGGRTYCGMIGDPAFYITRIERAPSAVCGPVPVNAVNWGSVKAIYR